MRSSKDCEIIGLEVKKVESLINGILGIFLLNEREYSTKKERGQATKNQRKSIEWDSGVK